MRLHRSWTRMRYGVILRQNSNNVELNGSEAATANGSPAPNSTAPVPNGKDPEFERQADRVVAEFSTSVNGNALKGTPTSYVRLMPRLIDEAVTRMDHVVRPPATNDLS